MPVLDGFLTKLPAKVNQPPLPHVRKIAEAFVDILEHDAHMLDLVNQKHQVGNRLNVGYTGFAETVIGRLVTSLLNFRIQLFDAPPLLVDFLQDGSKLRNQSLRLGERKDPVVHG